MARKSEKEESNKDVRLAATTRIWGCTVAILAISVPLSIPLRSSLIPLAAIGGAAAGTFAVWNSDEKKAQNKFLQQQQIELLERRIGDLETIISSDDLDLRVKLKIIEASQRDQQTLGDATQMKL
jgi:hypothetical protein